jgi:hypothetical protein
LGFTQLHLLGIAERRRGDDHAGSDRQADQAAYRPDTLMGWISGDGGLAISVA